MADSAFFRIKIFFFSAENQPGKRVYQTNIRFEENPFARVF